jgi:hypothetical protein
VAFNPWANCTPYIKTLMQQFSFQVYVLEI